MQVDIKNRRYAPVACESEIDIVLTIKGKSDNPISVGSIVVCLDTSGSMHGTPIRAAKTTVRNLIETFPDKIKIVEFNSTVQRLGDDATKPDELIDLVEGLGANGTTNIHGALIEAAKYSSSSVREDESNNVFLISDGQPCPNEGDNTTNGITSCVRAMQQKGFSISTFGLGSSYSEAMSNWAKKGGGNFFNIPHEDKMNIIMEAVAKRATTMIAKDCHVYCKGLNGAVLTRVWKPDATVEEGGNYDTRIGPIYNGEKITFMVTVKIPADGKPNESRKVVTFKVVGGTMETETYGTIIFSDDKKDLDDPQKVIEGRIRYYYAYYSKRVRNLLRKFDQKNALVIQTELCDYLIKQQKEQKKQNTLLNTLLAKAEQTMEEIMKKNTDQALRSTCSATEDTKHDANYLSKYWLLKEDN